MPSTFFAALDAAGPHPSLGGHADTYGRLIGSWTGEVHDHYPDGRSTIGSAEVHFAWVLEGRAVQDLWIGPARAERGSGPRPPRDRYGTTLRVFEPASEGWRVTWINPAGGSRTELVGRRQGDDVVQLGTRDGWPIRWSFVEIEPRSFRWLGHILERDGVGWRLETEFRFRRE
jgi:hypothetical protein